MDRLYIHMQPDWPRFRWDEAALTPRLSAVRHAQGRLLGRLEMLGFPLRKEADLIVMTSEIMKTSAIEGERLDQGQVRSSLARRLGIDIGRITPASRAVEGIVELMLDATRNFDRPLTSDRLFGWHAALFPTGRSGLREITAGAWRTPEAGPMQVVSGPPGWERVHFEAPEADRLSGEMAAFLEWFNAPPATDPVLKAALAHVWFVTLHPFEDGNGRIARAIAELALTRSDGIPQRFYSMSAQIEAEREAYYTILEQTQKGDLNITRWLSWFIECLDRSLKRAEDTLSAVLRKERVWRRVSEFEINDRQRKVINRLLDGFEGHLTSSKYAKLTRCSSDTAVRDIRELLAHGVLLRNPGGGRSVSYRLAENTPPPSRTSPS